MNSNIKMFYISTRGRTSLIESGLSAGADGCMCGWVGGWVAQGVMVLKSILTTWQGVGGVGIGLKPPKVSENC